MNSSAATENEIKQISTGKAVYKTACMTCHGENFDGRGDAGKYLKPPPRNLVTDPFIAGDSALEIYATVTNGLKGKAMPSFKLLSESDRQAVSAYIVFVRLKK